MKEWRTGLVRCNNKFRKMVATIALYTSLGGAVTPAARDANHRAASDQEWRSISTDQSIRLNKINDEPPTMRLP